MSDLLTMTEAPPVHGADARACDYCGEPFTPRAGSGGKPQRFCSKDCKDTFHAEAQRVQRRGSHVGECSDKRGDASPSNPSLEDVRRLLVNGTREYAKHFPEDFPAGLTPEQAVDATLLGWIDRGSNASGSSASEPAGEPFNWEPDDGAIVLQGQQAIACYLNADGDLVIRQERWITREDDDTIIVRKQNIMALIDRLCDIAGVGSSPG